MVAVKPVERCRVNGAAMQHVTRQTLPSLQAATGLVAVHITTVSANPPTTGHRINENKRLDYYLGSSWRSDVSLSHCYHTIRHLFCISMVSKLMTINGYTSNVY